MQRYEWERPGDLLHIDVKSLARFRKIGHRITGDRQKGRSYGVDYDKVHVAVDDATRLACVEVLADEQTPTVIGFLAREGIPDSRDGVRILLRRTGLRAIYQKSHTTTPVTQQGVFPA